MPELLFYQRPTVLNKDTHKAMRFSPVKDFGFTSNVNSVPLLAIEFFESSRDLPVLFSQDQEGAFFPIVLLSLKNQGHEQVDESGRWLGNYTPAFIRRYPFVLSGDKNVCFDADYAGLADAEGEGELLFADDGTYTDTLGKIIEFVTNFDAEHLRTREFCQAATEQDVFKPFILQVITADKKPLRLDGLFVIDESKLMALEDEVVTSWFRKGYLAWAYAHLHSLGALQRLSEQLNTRS
ncbi:SapC family protein [Pseudomonas sp.]|uniref:SapC family protein n=1 Tax=Pseudomonas sp. TaxID=306 RepID=UPI00272F9F07|nr:SapC family protein [Pseudomonas sp.]MDP2244390.1 SapC family protein [Pseudomonas sp.]